MTTELEHKAARERRYDLRTPIIRAIYDVCQAIEECGASEKLTHAVTLASALMEPVRVLLEERDALAAPVPAREWIPVGERLPDAIPVLAYGQNSHGKGHRMRAQFVRKSTLEDGADDEFGEYDEAKDAYFWPEGWYEWNECEETHWKIDIPVTHWMPLPPPPAADK